MRLVAGDASIEVDPDVGGRLVSWRVGDLELLGARSGVPEEYGCYPMAPWPGRLRGNEVQVGRERHEMEPTYAGWAMHGTVLARAWEVEVLGPSSVQMSIDLGSTWPWAGRTHLTWSLHGQSLTSQLTVTSAAVPFPAEVGWHPWFLRRLERGDDVAWSAAAVAMLERGDDHLPTGRRFAPTDVDGPYDDAFDVPDGRVELRWPGALSLSCQSSARWVVVFDELPDFVCVEPQTGPPDGLREAELVRPGRPKTASTTWTWTSLV